MGDGKFASIQKKPEASKVGVAEEKYKQKLAENRRLAREKAEQKAEEDRQRKEEERFDRCFLALLTLKKSCD